MQKARPDGLRTRPFLLSVPAGVPFLRAIAQGLLDGGLIGHGFPGLRSDPLALSDVRIFLPTQRAATELRKIFVDEMNGAAVLPRIEALGDYDEDEDAFEPLEEGGEELLPALGETERRLVLARLIRTWATTLARTMKDSDGEAELISTTPSEAISLAIELGRLIDSFDTEGADWTKIAPLIPPEHDTVWRMTGEFLDLAAKVWPAFLAEQNKIGAADRKNRQLRLLAERFAQTVPTSPVIVAGSTGSNPATVELMEIVSRLPNGAVILQGLDVLADDAAWDEIGGGVHADPVPPHVWTHPQYGFHRLLRTLGIQRGEIGVLGQEDRTRDARRALVSAALLPSDLTDRWAGLRMDAKTALGGVSLIEAANEREEALAIAVCLVEALRDDRRAALVTPDRPLARRVAAELRRWGVEAEDTAGLPLADSEAGILARLIAEAAVAQLAPDALLPMLRHPDARFGLDADILRRAADAFELGVLRGAAPPPGLDGLTRKLALERAASDVERRFWHPGKKALDDTRWEMASDLLTRVHTALEPLCLLGSGSREAPLSDIVRAHRDAIKAVAARAETDTKANDENAGALFDIFAEVLGEPTRKDENSGEAPGTSGEHARASLLRLSDYPSVFKALLRGKTARARGALHPRLRILGTLEARLLGFDRVVLGGLNETTWPAQTKNDAFLSRPMRGALGLPPPEWRVGLSAHDFEQALGGMDVVLTRARKAGGAPSVAARWLQRLEALSGEAWNEVSARGDAVLNMARALDDTQGRRPPLRGPTPRPARELRPVRLSVTEVETLIRDPYAVYAKHVLRLQPLEAVGATPEASDRGNIIHDALAEFTATQNVHAPDAAEKLIAIGREGFLPYLDFPDVQALWWPRFERIAHWFVDWERKRTGIARTYSEQRGALQFDTSAGRTFTLGGRADRLDALETGDYSVLDYKTGQPPGDKEVIAGFAPQLPLEAAILAQSGFEQVPPGPARDFVYVRLTGQSEAGLVKTIDLKGRTPTEVADERLARLKELIDLYEQEDTPYRSHTYPKFARRVSGPYDHLARYAEWSVAPDADENGEANGDGA